MSKRQRIRELLLELYKQDRRNTIAFNRDAHEQAVLDSGRLLEDIVEEEANRLRREVKKEYAKRRISTRGVTND